MNEIKRNILFVLSVILLFLMMAASLEAQERQTYRFGYSSSLNPEILIKRMAPMMNILSGALDSDIEFVHKKTFSEMQKAYINQEIDFGIINAYSFIRILPYNAVVPVAARRINHSKKYQSYFFARKDSGITSIEDLKGKVVALGDPYSTSSYLIPQNTFRAGGVIPEVDFAETIIISKQDSLILSVLNRTADAGACASFIFNEQPDEITSGLHVFRRSEFFPLGPFVANKNLAPEIIDTIREVLFALSETEAGQRVLDSAEVEGFDPVDISDYNGLIEIMNSLNIN